MRRLHVLGWMILVVAASSEPRARALVVVIGTLRGGPVAWRSLRDHVVDSLSGPRGDVKVALLVGGACALASGAALFVSSKLPSVVDGASVECARDSSVGWVAGATSIAGCEEGLGWENQSAGSMIP